MENTNHYDAPKSEIIEQHKYSFFGGWLRCFQILHIISLSLIGLMIVAYIWMYTAEYFEEIYINELVAIGFEIIPDLVLSVVVLYYIKIKSSSTPRKLVTYLGYYVGVTFVVYAILFYFHSTEQISEKPTSFWGSVIYYWIWTSYFKKSERVKVYYGDNAR